MHNLIILLKKENEKMLIKEIIMRINYSAKVALTASIMPITIYR